MNGTLAPVGMTLHVSYCDSFFTTAFCMAFSLLTLQPTHPLSVRSCLRRQHRCANLATLAMRTCHISLTPTMSALCLLGPSSDRYCRDRYCLRIRLCSQCPCDCSHSLWSIPLHKKEQDVGVDVCMLCHGDCVKPVMGSH